MSWKLDQGFAEVVLGDRPGALCVAFGFSPFRDDNGRYQHIEWLEQLCAWPADREELESKVGEAMATGDPVDIYVCPAVRHANAKRRRKGDALPPKVLWADLDGQPKDRELYERLVAGGSLVVSSGSDGHRHLYLPLAAPVDLGTFNELNRTLAEKLGADAKWADNSVLRVPGTLNWKPTVPQVGVAAGSPAPVVVIQ